MRIRTSRMHTTGTNTKQKNHKPIGAPTAESGRGELQEP